MRSSGAPPADKAKAGVDARYRVSQGVALDLTYNTDFSHVEADTQQINLTRFNLFFPEKREFFLENADIFGFGDIPYEPKSGYEKRRNAVVLLSALFGTFETGEPLSLRGGVRLSGRAGSWGLGLLSIHHESQRCRAGKYVHRCAGTPRSLLPFRRRFIFVSRESAEPGDFNRWSGGDLNLRVGQKWSASAFWAATTGPELRGDNDQKKSRPSGTTAFSTHR